MVRVVHLTYIVVIVELNQGQLEIGLLPKQDCDWHGLAWCRLPLWSARAFKVKVLILLGAVANADACVVTAATTNLFIPCLLRVIFVCSEAQAGFDVVVSC